MPNNTLQASLIQLPNDSVSCGYRRIGAYEFAQVFFSASAQFTGTEQEFAATGKAYRYIQTSQFTRMPL